MKWLGVFVVLITVLMVITIVILANADILPSEIKTLYDFPGGDKVGHVLLMGILGLFVNLAVVSTLEGRPIRKIVVTTVILGLAITLEETLQLFFSTRTFSLLDLFANYFGLAVSAVLVAWLVIKKKMIVE